MIGTLLTVWNTYSGKFKWIAIAVVAVLLVAGFFYIKSLRSDLQLSEERGVVLERELQTAEAEKAHIVSEVVEGRETITALQAQKQKHAQDAAKAKRNLEKLSSEYQDLMAADPEGFTQVIESGYNKFVNQLNCYTGGEGCEDPQQPE